MKKFLSVATAVLLVLMLAMPAMAEVAINGSYRARLWYGGNYDLNKDNDDSDPALFTDNRLRILLDVKVAENVQVFGNFDLTERWWGGNGTEKNYQNFQVNEGFLKFLVPGTPIWFQVGRQNVTWYYGVIAAVDMRDRIKAWVEIKDIGLNAGLAMDDNQESLLTASTKDADNTGYSGWVKMKVAGWDLGLIGAYVDNQIDNGTTDNDSATILVGLGAIGAAGPVKLGLEAATKLGTAKTKASGTATWTEKDNQGFGVLLTASAPVGPVGLSAAFALATGDDADTDDKDESYTFDGDSPACGIILFANDWNPEIVPQAGRYAADNGWSNAVGGKIGATYAPIKPLTFGLAALYATTMQDNAAGVGGAYGFEFDLTASYDIAQNVNLLLGMAYLLPGSYLDDLGYEDAAMGAVAKFEVKF